MDGRDAPATKGDLEDLSAGLRGEMRAMEDRLRTETKEMEDHLVESIRDSETKLLKAFYTFAESNQARLASIETEGDAMRKRLRILESRMTDVEKRLNMPPAA